MLRGAAGAFFGPFAFAGAGAPAARWRVLSQTAHALALRIDDRTLELVAPAAQGLYPEGAGNLFRDPMHPLLAGDVVRMAGMTVEVLQANAHGPTRARFTFARPLETTPNAWIDERFDGLREAELPAVGFGAPYDP